MYFSTSYMGDWLKGWYDSVTTVVQSDLYYSYNILGNTSQDFVIEYNVHQNIHIVISDLNIRYSTEISEADYILLQRRCFMLGRYVN